MAMFEEKIIKKVPGNPCPDPKEKQGYIEDLNTKTRVELVELLERQDKLLSNKGFINKLPDKGGKIKEFRGRVAEALAEIDHIEKTRVLLSDLSLSGNVTDEIEWTGRLTGVLDDNGNTNSSDDETDPMKIIASHGGTALYKKKKHRRLKELEEFQKDVSGTDASASLIPEEDLSKQKSQISIESSSLQDSAGSSQVNSGDDSYSKYLCNKVDKLPEKKRELFKPHCTTKSGVHPGLFIPKHQGPHWEVTAATPPPPVHGAIKLISLQDSMQLQQEQAAKLKDVQAKHASEKLASNLSIKLGSMLPDLSSKNDYRDVQEAYESSNSSEEEENYGQSDEDDKRDTIVYTYTE